MKTHFGRNFYQLKTHFPKKYLSLDIYTQGRYQIILNTGRLFCVSGSSYQRMYLVFVVDASYSVGAAYFEQIKYFIIDIVRGLPIGRSTVRVALVRFDSRVEIINGFLDSLAVFTESVCNMTYPSNFGTNTGGALRTVRETVMTFCYTCCN